MQKTFTDQLGREVTLPYPPQRIISLVPSQTELLFDLGLSKAVIGRTRFCIHPDPLVQQATVVGGTKNLNLEKIRALKPDLIIGNKEENVQDQIESLMEEFPVWLSDVNDLESAQQMISGIGALVNRQPEADYLNHLIHSGFSDLQTLALQQQIHSRVAYLIWRDPLMLVGKQTFIDHLLTLNGMENVLTVPRYPAMSPAALAALHPEWVFLSSEPYPFKALHFAEIQQIWPEAKIRIVDGEMFSWYGSRLVKAVQYFFEFQKTLSL